MIDNSKNIKMERKYLPGDLEISSWENIQPFFEELLDRKLDTTQDIEKWLRDRSELEAVMEEELAWRYIKMNCDTEDKVLSKHFEKFINEIEPHINEYSNRLDKKFADNPFSGKLDDDKYYVLKRALRRRIEIFRKENIPIFSEMHVKEQEYGRISASMTIHYADKELTMQQAKNYLKEVDRKNRREVFSLMGQRRLKDKKQLDDLLSELIKLRTNIAHNAGYNNYLEYKFDELERFDYSIDECRQFHDAVEKVVMPLVNNIYKQRKEKLGVDSLKPWDLDVDENSRPPLKPFDTTDQLIELSIKTFYKVKPRYADFLNIMKENGYLDLGSRKGKAPGGFNYPLYESNIPFIFMNATHNLRDVETLMHEGGHAIHSFLCKDIELTTYKETPAEVAEVASMAMELISMEYWKLFFDDKDELRRAKKGQLEGIMRVLPWIATIDKFQHWLYTKPNHSVKEREQAWNDIYSRFSSDIIDWKGYEEIYQNIWQNQLHIFEVPLYYIEYGIAQLAAIALWKNYKSDPEKTLSQYEKALSLGYSKPILQIYEAAGIKFDFSKSYINELASFLKNELLKYE